MAQLSSRGLKLYQIGMADIFPEALRLTTQEKRGIWPDAPPRSALPITQCLQAHSLISVQNPTGNSASLLPTQAAVAKIMPLLGLAQAKAKAAGRELELSHRPPTVRWTLLLTESASPCRVQTRKVIPAMGTTRERHWPATCP